MGSQIMSYFYIPLALLLIGAHARVTNNVEPVRKCLDKWISNNGTCYLIEKTARRTFEHAKAWCQVEHGTLFVPHSFEENNFVMSQTAEMAFTWNGLSQKKEEPKWNQKNGINVDELNWNEPYNEQTDSSGSTPNRCGVVANIQGERTLYWTSCEEKHFYICEELNKTEVFNQVPQPEEPLLKIIAKCENGWICLENSSCYFIEKKYRSTFENAKRECEKKNGTMFSPTTMIEYKTLMANTEIYEHTWNELPKPQWKTKEKYKTAFFENKIDWLVKNSYADDAVNGYNNAANIICAAYYNGNNKTTNYVYYYPCNHKYLYICQKKEVTC